MILARAGASASSPANLVMKKYASTLLVLVVLAGIAFAVRSTSKPPQSAPETLVMSGEVWATTYHIKVPGFAGDATARAELQAAVEAEFRFIDDSMSRFKDGSVVDRFNHSTSVAPHPVPAELVEVVSLAQHISHETGGAYDITVGPLVRLWGFDRVKGRATAPSDEDEAKARLQVGYQRLNATDNPPTLTKTVPELELDLSSIAKGAGVDRVARALERLGYRNYLVEIGGEIRVQGRNAQGEPWKVGVEKPLVDRQEVFRVLQMTQGAVATSGEYRNFYELNGRRVSHSIDVRTGLPVSHPLMSVAVVADTCVEADGWATAMNVLGPDEGIEKADELGLAVLFVIADDSNELTARESRAFSERLGATPGPRSEP